MVLISFKLKCGYDELIWGHFSVLINLSSTSLFKCSIVVFSVSNCICMKCYYLNKTEVWQHNLCRVCACVLQCILLFIWTTELVRTDVDIFCIGNLCQHEWPVTMYHDLQLNVSQSCIWTDANASLYLSLPLSLSYAYLCGTLLCPTQQCASLKCPDWRLTTSIRSTSCLAELVPRGLKMEPSRATPCHLDRVDLGAGLSARTAECIKCCITTFNYSIQLLRIIFLKKHNFHVIRYFFF